MPQKSQQLFDDDGGHPLSQSTHVETSRTRGGTPASAAKRKLDAGGGVTLPQKRKRKVVEKEKEKDVAPAKPGPSSKVSPPLVPLFRSRLKWSFLGGEETKTCS